MVASPRTEFKRACSVTAAHFLTLDFTALTDERAIWKDGFILQDKLRGTSVKIFSLIELERGITYTTSHGSTLVRTSHTEARLNDQISLAVDLSDAAVSPRASIGDDDDEPTESAGEPTGGSTVGAAGGVTGGGSSAVIGSALEHVRALSASPSAADLAELQRTLTHLPTPDDGWLDSFLALDGVQALLDVLSHSQQQQAAAPSRLSTSPRGPPPTQLTTPTALPPVSLAYVRSSSQSRTPASARAVVEPRTCAACGAGMERTDGHP